MYGSDVVAARYCGFAKPPSAPIGLWMHGWYPESRPLDRPERLFDVTMAHLRDERYWVTTERQAAFLRSLGFPQAQAIGLPLVYVPKPQVTRERDSLLVMPAHSLPANDRAWATADYVAAIRALRPEFDRICICVNGHDWVRGNWVHDFRAAGFEVIRGAGDSSSLERMASLFTQFESVTTNGFGSLIAYASAFGARASLYGPFSEVTTATLRSIPFFIDNPELMVAESRYSEEDYCREVFPEFFRHPAAAEERVAWGQKEIGRQNKVGPEELRSLFGWSPIGRATSTAKAFARRAPRLVPEPVKTELAERLTGKGRSARRERRRLESMEAGAPGATPLFGVAFEFADARTYLDAYDDCFVQHAYRFRATSERPVVVDGHAGSGLSVLYFKCLYPQCRIVALEAASATLAMLARNCRSYGLTDVELLPGEPSESILASALHGRVGERTGPAESGRAFLPPFAFGDELVEVIDMLKLRVDAAQPGGLLDIAGLLDHVESVALDYHARVGEPQNLGRVFDALENAGFRVAVQSPDSARMRPLVAIPSSGERNARLRILGFRM